MNQYQLKSGITVTLDENGALNAIDSNRALLTIMGYAPNDTTGDYELWTNQEDGSRVWLSMKDGVSIEDISGTLNAMYIAPLDNLSFLQALCVRLNIMVSPVTTINGSLVAEWKAERLSVYNPARVDLHGMLVSDMQYYSAVNPIVGHAIAAVAMKVIGVGQHAFITLANESEPKIFNLTAEGVGMLEAAGLLNKTVFDAPELNKFITFGIENNEQLVHECIENARLRLVAARADQVVPAEHQPNADQADTAGGELMVGDHVASSQNQQMIEGEAKDEAHGKGEATAVQPTEAAGSPVVQSPAEPETESHSPVSKGNEQQVSVLGLGE